MKFRNMYLKYHSPAGDDGAGDGGTGGSDELATLPADVQEKLKELETLKSHHEKLLGETKAAKAKAKAAKTDSEKSAAEAKVAEAKAALKAKKAEAKQNAKNAKKSAKAELAAWKNLAK